MPYYDISRKNQLIASDLKIKSFEIREAMGFKNNWLSGLRFFFMYVSIPECEGLSWLLDQAEIHNHLVSSIELDIKKAATSQPDKETIEDLDDVIQIFCNTKETILKALERNSVQKEISNRRQDNQSISISARPNNVLGDRNSAYTWLIKKSLQIRMNAPVEINQLIQVKHLDSIDNYPLKSPGIRWQDCPMVR